MFAALDGGVRGLRERAVGVNVIESEGMFSWL